MSGLKSNTLHSHSIPVKAYNPNSRASQMQKGFISPELKVARYFGAEVFDYDYSQDETNNILSYHINLKNDEDVIYLNYRLQELVNYVRNNLVDDLRYNYPCVFINISYKDIVTGNVLDKYIVIGHNGFKDNHLNFYIYDIDNFRNKIVLFNTPCIITINIMELFQSCNSLSEYQLNEIKKILYGIPNPLPLSAVASDYKYSKKSLFTFVNLFENERFYTKWWKMFKYFKYRFMNK